MSTDTDKLIAQLTQDLKPVKPMAGAGTLALILSTLSLTATFAAITIFTKGIRADWQVMLGEHVCQTAGISMAGFLAAYAAFKLSVPDTRIRTIERVILGLASFIWVLLIAGQIGAESPEAGYRNCLTDFSLLFIIPFAAGIYMASHAAPVWSGWAGYALALAVGSFSALGMRFACPNEQPAHLLVWHYLPVLAFAVVGIGLGQILLKRKKSSPT